MFNTQFDKRPRVHCEAGDPIKILYTGVYDDFGHLELEPYAKVNLYDEIQSHADSVNIHILLAQYANGDPEALQRIQGVFGDFTQMPSTYAELLNTVIKGENTFNSLPVEIRAKFNHSFAEFMAGIGTPAWAEKLSEGENTPSDAPAAPTDTKEGAE